MTENKYSTIQASPSIEGGVVVGLTKRCSQCGKEKPLTEFYARRKGAQRLPLAHCKQCHLGYARRKREAYRALHPLPAPPVYPEGYQRCCHCHEVKPYSEFHRNRSRENGIHRECKACTSESRRKKTPPKVYRGTDGRLYIENTRPGRASLYWSPNMLSLLRRYYPNSPNSEVAEMLGVRPETVIDKAKALGLKKSPAYLSELSRSKGILGAIANKKRIRELQQSQ